MRIGFLSQLGQLPLALITSLGYLGFTAFDGCPQVIGRIIVGGVIFFLIARPWGRLTTLKRLTLRTSGTLLAAGNLVKMLTSFALAYLKKLVNLI